MKGKDPVEQSPIYNRKLLLDGKKRNAVLDLWEVRRYGADSYGDVDYVSIYGMRPAAWYAKGVRLLGRTAVECTRDPLGEMIGKDVAAVSARAPHTTGVLVVDLFAGLGNTLYWLLSHLAAARGGYSGKPSMSTDLTTPLYPTSVDFIEAESSIIYFHQCQLEFCERFNAG